MLLLRHSLPPTSPLHQHRHRIPLLALPTLGFFPVSLPQFTSFLKMLLLRHPYLRHPYTIPPSPPYAKKADHTPSPPSDPPHRVNHPRIFSRLSTSIYAIFKCFYSDTPYLQRHPYTIPQCPPCVKRLNIAVPILLGPVLQRGDALLHTGLLREDRRS